MVVESCASEIQLDEFVLTPFFRNGCSEDLGPGPWSCDIFRWIINVQLSDSKPVWSSREQVKESVQPYHANCRNGTILPISVFYIVDVEVSIVHMVT